jgi:hypothetical protein
MYRLAEIGRLLAIRLTAADADRICFSNTIGLKISDCRVSADTQGAAGDVQGGLSQLKALSEKNEDDQEAREEVVGLIARNPGELSYLSSNDLKNGAIVIVLTDLEPD